MAHLSHFRAQVFDLGGRAFDKRLPAAPGFFGHPVEPRRVKFVTAIFVDKLAPVDPGLIGQFYHRTVDRHNPAVDPVKLVDQRLDPVVVQVQFVDQFDDLGAQFLVFGLFPGRKRRVFVQRRRDAQVLHVGKHRIIGRDPAEGFKHPRFQRRFHCRKRHVDLFVLVVVVFVFGFFNRVAVGILLGLGVFRGGFGGLGVQALDHRRVFRFVVHATAKCRLQVNDIAQQNVFVQKFVAPDSDGLEGQRAFAKSRDHGVSAGLDALGDGNLAFAAQKFDGSHFAQIHAHRIVGAVELFGLGRRNRHFARRRRLDHGG